MEVTRKDIQNLPELFSKELSKALFYEEFTAGEIQKVMKQVDTVTFAKAGMIMEFRLSNLRRM